MAFLFLKKAAKSSLIFLNAVLALCLIAGSFGARLNPETWWFLGYFAMGIPYFFIGLLFFALGWLATRPVWSLISLISIILCWQAVTEAIPARTSAHFSVQKKPNQLRVVSWNVEHFNILQHKTHPETKTSMINLMNEYNPDIACFQEVVASTQIQKSINYLPDLQNAMHFPYVHYSFNPKLDFDQNHHFGLTIFSKYPIIATHTYQYPPGDYNSIFQHADILKNNDTIRVFNVHLQSLKFSSANREYMEDPGLQNETDLKQSKNILNKLSIGFLKRAKQARRIHKAIQQSPYPVIVCGDFNDLPNSFAYNQIGKDLQNAFAEKGAGTGRTYSGISPTLRIDQIFASQDFTIEQYLRVRKKLSDHYPIFTDLMLQKAE